jgi:fucose 4-O-acetylase-like acetyltransferase
MKKRIFYLDNLRIFLISLVIFHHTAIAYGASGGFYYIEVDEISVSAILLTIFAAVNQAYFMGLLFLISGYFTPPSYNRKGAGQFVKDRFLRLGVPLLIYALLIGPSLVYLLHYSQVMTYKTFFLQIILTLKEVNLGPLWFVEALILFNLGYLIWRRFKASGTDNKNEQKELPTNRCILITALASGLIAFLVRLAYPAGEEFLALQLVILLCIYFFSL